MSGVREILCFKTAAPFEQLKRGLKILNNHKPYKTRPTEFCCPNYMKTDTTLIDKTGVTVREFIKRAIFKERWKEVAKILAENIHKKNYTHRKSTYVLNVTILYLLQHEHAKSNGVFAEYLQLLLRCSDEEMKRKVIRRIMTMTKPKKKQDKKIAEPISNA